MSGPLSGNRRAAKANNVIIGRTWLDASGHALGLSTSDRLKLRDMEQGAFAFGAAFSRPGVVHFRSDEVRTTHPIAAVLAL
jgi:hypothetical protein